MLLRRCLTGNFEIKEPDVFLFRLRFSIRFRRPLIRSLEAVSVDTDAFREAVNSSRSDTLASSTDTLSSTGSLVGTVFEVEAANKRVIRRCDVVAALFFKTCFGLSFDTLLFRGTVCFLCGGSSSASSGGVTLNTGTEQSPPGQMYFAKRWLSAIRCSMYATFSSATALGQTPHPGCGPRTIGIYGLTVSCNKQ